MVCDQEITILDLAGRGYSIEEIAARLAISPKTVDVRFCTLFEKLGVRSYGEAVIKAWGLGLLKVPQELIVIPDGLDEL